MDTRKSSYYDSMNSNYGNFFLSPQLLNNTLKTKNMLGVDISDSDLEKLIMNPHNFEDKLRKIVTTMYRQVPLYNIMLIYKHQH